MYSPLKEAMLKLEVGMTLDPGSSRQQKYFHYFKLHGLNLVSGILMVVGIILSFFYIHVGGALVGLAVGMSFYDELQRYFFHARDYATIEGLFKTLMLVGLLLYLLLAATSFVIATVIGFVVMSLIHLFNHKST